MTYKNLGDGFDVLLSGALNEMRDIERISFENSNLMGIIWQSLCVWLFVYFIFNQKEKTIRKGNDLFFVFSILSSIFFVIVTFIDQSGLSRWYTIVTAGACVSCLFKLYPKKGKYITVGVIIPSLLLLLLATLFKNAEYLIGDGLDSAFRDILDPTTLDIYYAGPVNVNNAIGTYEYNQDWPFENIINDLLGGMPIINHYIDFTQTTPYLYNNYIGRVWDNHRGDQIIPLIGQSIIYFGYVFAPLLSVISVIIMRWADFMFKHCCSFLIYLYAFLGVWFGVEAMMLNMAINLTWFWIRIIPFYLVLSSTNLLVKEQNAYKITHI